MKTNAALVTLVREYRGWTQAELAAATGLSQGYISKVENDMVEPSDDSVQRIAAELDWPVHFFGRDERVYGFGTACMYHRKRASLAVKTLHQVQAMVNIVRMALGPLLRDLEIDAENRFPVMDIDEFQGDPAQVADLLRGTWRLPLGPLDNVVRTIESAGGIVYRVDFGTRLLDAVSHWAPGMPPLFFVNTAAPGDRLRFSLVHELGHVVMHALPNNDMEREANVFASEFLMPAMEIRPMLANLDLAHAAQLKPFWKVSMAALILRARDLGCISPQKASRLYMQMSSLGYRTTEPVQVSIEEPTVARRIIDVLRLDQGYSTGDLVRIAGIAADAFHQELGSAPTLRPLR